MKADEYCATPATVLVIRDGVATLTACRGTPDHAPWSRRGESEVAYFQGPAHPGASGASKGVGVVYLSVQVGADGRARAVQVLAGPSDLAETSVENVKTWRFYDGAARTLTIGYRYSLVEGRCYRNYAALSGAGTLMNVIGCTPPSGSVKSSAIP